MPSNQPNSDRKEKFEAKFLKGTKDADLGVYCSLFSAKSDIEGQDGGVVSALLVKGFREGLFHAAIVVRRIQGYSAEAVVAENLEDVLTAKGTKYLKVNVTKKLRELIAKGKRRIAIVCTPCEAAVARKIQQTIGKNCEITIIGLFCFESFNGEKLKEGVKSHLGINLDDAEKTQIRQGKFTAVVKGKEASCRVKDLDGAVENACHICDDFTSRSADVSVGSAGSKKGYSTVIVRTNRGAKLVENLEAAKEDANKQEIAK